MNNIKVPNKILVACSWMIVFLTFGLLHFFDINFSFLNFSICTLKRLTNLSCIACGCTRATDALTHLRFRDAFLYNPLYIILLVTGLVYAIILSIDVFIHDKKTIKTNKTTIKILTIILIVACIFFSIIRNTPFYLNWFYV